MTNDRRRARSLGFVGAVVATVVCAAGFAASVADALAPGTPPAAPLSITPDTGPSDAAFALSFAAPQACPGDGTAGYRWHTFITPRSVDPATVTFSGSGVPQGPAFTAALRNPVAAITNQLPTLVDGFVNPPTNVTFIAASFGAVSPGDYWLGISCTDADLTPPLETLRYWAAPVTITSTAGAGPNNFTLSVASPTTTTTTVGGATTTTVAGATTTTSAAATTTTVGGPTTTVAGATTVPDTSTTVDGGSSTSSTSTTVDVSTSAPTTTLFTSVSSSGGSPSSPAFFTPVQSLASTGSSPMGLVVWGVLLVVFGRMAILLGRSPAVESAAESSPPS
jgi:hypothetical protein